MAAPDDDPLAELKTSLDEDEPFFPSPGAPAKGNAARPGGPPAQQASPPPRPQTGTVPVSAAPPPLPRKPPSGRARAASERGGAASSSRSPHDLRPISRAARAEASARRLARREARVLPAGDQDQRRDAGAGALALLRGRSRSGAAARDRLGD